MNTEKNLSPPAPMPRHSSKCSSAPLVRLLLVLMSLVCLTGCGGCDTRTAAQKARQAAKEKLEAEEKKKKEEEEKKKKEPFQLAPVTPLLSEAIVSTTDEGSVRLAKPGHWTATVQQMLANDDNFNGRTTVAAVDSRQRPTPLPDTSFAMISSRPALLAKGRPKRVLNEVLPPPGATRMQIHSALTAGGGTPVDATQDLWTMMPSHQYFLMVLAREPARYAFLKVADSVRAPYEDENGVSQPHYRVVLADGSKPAPLPDNVLAWTSVAYFVWDEVNLDRLTPEQQQALLDWVHWGGRLIINGPDSLATLRGSFLDEFLPVDGGKAIEVGDDDLAGLNDYWAKRTTGAAPPPLKTTRPWSGVELTPRKGVGQALPGAEGLFYEGAVGSGSIVVSAIQLAERDLVNWPGFDSFLNGALLRRPARRFRSEEDGQWFGLQTLWANETYENRARDAYFTTPLRWFARDAGTKANAELVYSDVAPDPNNPWQGMGTPIPEAQSLVDRPGGLGSWNEFGPVSDAARQALSDAAGVRVPGASFVVVCLAVYLVILVPLNWMVFHALGRVEWAWIAAPLIALAGTFAVVRQAQLDIGFVRSQTEISLLELQGARPRGHLSRYMALYTSLSTIYNTEFEDPTAVATPFPAAVTDASRPIIGDGTTTVEFEKYDHPRLKGLPVSSASTQFLHSEQMFPLTGALRLSHPSTSSTAYQLENKTGYDLSDAVVIRRYYSGGRWLYKGVWLGQLRNGTSQLLAMVDVTPERNRLLFESERGEAAKVDFHKRLNVDGLLQLAFKFPAESGDLHDPINGQREEVRLVARIDEPLVGAVTNPAASQTTAATVVLAHLDVKLGPQQSPDANSPRDVGGDRRNAAEEEEALGEFPGI